MWDRLRVRFGWVACLLAIAVSASAMSAAADDPAIAVEPLPGEVPAGGIEEPRLNQEINPQIAARIDRIRQAFDSMVFRSTRFNASRKFVDRLEAMLHLKLESSARDFALSDVQKQKLLLEIPLSGVAAESAPPSGGRRNCMTWT